MSFEQKLVILLLSVIILQGLYWSVLCVNLVNKIMSKNYYDYVVSSKAGEEKKPMRVRLEEPGLDVNKELQF